MSQSSVNPPPTRTWRDIPQPVTTRGMSREGRKRLALVLGAAGWGIFELVSIWEANPARITAVASSVPLRDIALRTDGVLDKAWVERTLDLPKGAGLMALNLSALQERLLATDQIRSAVVTRRFPDILVVNLQERSPVARIMARLGSAAPRVYMVARDGTVYQGTGYDRRLADGLPFLDGVKLSRSGDGFSRIDGMDRVSDLLGTALASTPALYRTFRVVSLARLAADGTIEVRSTEVDSITFGAGTDGFYGQLARLDFILDETRRQNPSQPLKTVNLAVGGGQVPVAFDAPEAGARGSRASAAPEQPTLGAALFSYPPRNSSSSKRDF